MKTLALVSQKGGAGKTSIAVHLATAAVAAGFRTALIDLDPQATARRWGDKRQASEPEVIGDHASRLPFLIEAARANGADLLLIDTAPAADQASLAAARAADLILMPCRPAAFDLEAIETTIDLVAMSKKPGAVVINAAPIRSGIVAEARRGLEAKGVHVAPQNIHARVSYSHSVIDGRTALEFEPDGKAAAEIAALFEWACGQVGLQAKPQARGPTGQHDLLPATPQTRVPAGPHVGSATGQHDIASARPRAGKASGPQAGIAAEGQAGVPASEHEGMRT